MWVRLASSLHKRHMGKGGFKALHNRHIWVRVASELDKTHNYGCGWLQSLTQWAYGPWWRQTCRRGIWPWVTSGTCRRGPGWVRVASQMSTVASQIYTRGISSKVALGWLQTYARGRWARVASDLHKRQVGQCGFRPTQEAGGPGWLQTYTSGRWARVASNLHKRQVGQGGVSTRGLCSLSRMFSWILGDMIIIFCVM